MAALTEATGDPESALIRRAGDGARYVWTVRSLATAIALRLNERHGTPRPPEHRSPGGLGAAAYARVRAFVEDHIGEHLSLDALAAVAGISRFHFARQFRRRTGRSPMEFVLRSRVERSKAMLRAGQATVGEVAAALGFADQSHFTRAFRRFVGTTPRRYASHRRGLGEEARAPSGASASPFDGG